jgi:hypothetical protein
MINTKSKKRNEGLKTLTINEKRAAATSFTISNSLYQQCIFVTTTRNEPSKIATKILKYNT